VRGRAVMLIPHRTSGVEEGALPPDYRRIPQVCSSGVLRGYSGVYAGEETGS